MLDHLRRSVLIALVFLILVFVYAYIGTGVSQLLFHHQANGSLTASGSSLIGQSWSQTKCPGHPDGSCVFQGRPDNTGPYAAVVCAANAKNCTPSSGGNNPLVANGVNGQSGATNLGPRSKTLLQNTQALVAYWKQMGVPDPTTDLVTTSGSGLDPDIAPEDATVQIPMVAAATGLSQQALTQLVHKYTHGPQWGFLGSSWINVLSLNEGLHTLETQSGH